MMMIMIIGSTNTHTESCNILMNMSTYVVTRKDIHLNTEEKQNIKTH